MDVGSITMVWNVLGGLQVQRPDVPYNSDEGWEFIKPERGCAVVNMGDAMRRFTGDRVRSSLHRVAYAPGDQATHDRYSVAYFSRPLNSVEVKPLDFGDKDAVLANGKGILQTLSTLRRSSTLRAAFLCLRIALSGN